MELQLNIKSSEMKKFELLVFALLALAATNYGQTNLITTNRLQVRDSIKLGNYWYNHLNGKNIYNSDGSLTANRKVNLNRKKLEFVDTSASGDIYKSTTNYVNNDEEYTQIRKESFDLNTGDYWFSGVRLQDGLLAHENEFTAIGLTRKLRIASNPLYASWQFTQTAGIQMRESTLSIDNDIFNVRVMGYNALTNTKITVDSTTFKVKKDGFSATSFIVNNTASRIGSDFYKNNVGEDSVLTTDINGNFKLKHIAAVGAQNIATYDLTLTANRRLGFNNQGLTFDSVGLFRIRDTAVSATGKAYGMISDFNNGTDNLVYDSLMSYSAVHNSLYGFKWRANDMNNLDTLSEMRFSENGLEVSAPLKASGAVIANVTSTSASTYNVTKTDYTVVCTGTGSININLPSAAASVGRLINVRVNNNTQRVYPNGSDTIEGSTNFITNNSTGTYILQCVSATNWIVLSTYN
jgi:hypothetical protein